MPRKFIKGLLPDYQIIKEHKSLQFLGERLHEPNLWHLNRRSVSSAVAIGLFIAFVPLPTQMVMAAALAIMIKANLPISVVLVWVSNPVTMPPLFYFAYRVGAWTLQVPTTGKFFGFSDEGFIHGLQYIWQPFLLGCLMVGLISAFLGFLFVRLGWRVFVANQWKTRMLKRK